jgi:peptidoglycan/LPS O-acetylase OafA/YrhL
MRIVLQSKLAQSGKYRPDIDGVRAIAVLSVLSFHAKVDGFSGGFVGVDIFFVISGYLITSIIAKDRNLGRFSFLSFYERRMRRIFPALFSVIFFCTLASATLFAPIDFMTFGKSMVASTCFVSNIFFLRSTGVDGYFGDSSNLQVLLHTWSLSVEEQFYLLFPALVLLLTRSAKGWVTQSLSLLTGISFLVNIWLTLHSQPRAFYTLPPRAWELLIGSLLAIKAAPPLRRRLFREIAGTAGLGLIACAVTLFTKDTTFPGFSALVPCFGAWLIIYAGEEGSSCVKTILSFPPLVFIGVISYSLYLWHWPLIVFSQYFAAGDLNGAETVGVILSSLLVAFLSFEFIESPFRGRDSTFSRRQIFTFGLAASMVSIMFGLVIYKYRGIPERYDKLTRQLVLSNSGRKSDYQSVCSNWKRPVRSVADINFCNFGTSASKKIMFWGDSHVQQLYPLIKTLFDKGEFGNHGVILAIVPGCPPTEHMNFVSKNNHCDSFATFAMVRAEEEDIDTVYIGFNTWWEYHQNALCPSVDGKCIGKISLPEVRRRFLDELSDHIQRLKQHGKRVVVSLPFPMYDKSIPDLEIRNAVFGRFGLAGVAKDDTSPEFRSEILTVAERGGADTFDPRESLCNKLGCITQVRGISIYKDDHHIAASQIGILEENLKQVLHLQVSSFGSSGISVR